MSEPSDREINRVLAEFMGHQVLDVGDYDICCQDQEDKDLAYCFRAYTVCVASAFTLLKKMPRSLFLVQNPDSSVWEAWLNTKRHGRS